MSPYFSQKKPTEALIEKPEPAQNTSVSRLEKEQNVTVVNLQLKNLKSSDTDFEIRKQLFSNTHVIKVEAQTDNLTGKCLGQGFA